MRYQVMNSGAGIEASGVLKMILFRYTMEIDTTQYEAITVAI